MLFTPLSHPIHSPRGDFTEILDSELQIFQTLEIGSNIGIGSKSVNPSTDVINTDLKSAKICSKSVKIG